MYVSMSRTRTKSRHAYSHQLSRIASNGAEFKAGFLHEMLENSVRGQANSMAVSLKLSAQRDEWLHISTAPNDLDHNVKGDIPMNIDGNTVDDWSRAFLDWRWTKPVQ